VEDLEEEDQDMQPEANGSAVPKAPAPEAAEATARAMSIADQIAFGKKNVTSLFQVNDPDEWSTAASCYCCLVTMLPSVLVMSSAFVFVPLPCQWW